MYLDDESLALEPVLVAQGRELRGITTSDAVFVRATSDAVMRRGLT
jgi:hypothetical protein